MKDQPPKNRVETNIPKTINDVLSIGKTTIGKKIKDLLGPDFPEAQINNKGQLGQWIEEHVFGQKPHNDSEPDLLEAGVELKVTPFRKLKNGQLTSKERLVLNMINYESENLDDFEKSSFWKKNHHLYILFYEYVKDLPKSEYKIYKDLLLQFSDEDIKQIRQDWKIIVDKIKHGEAHKISESDTMYLAACTKGVDSSIKRNQPYSVVQAKPRAYSLKSSYMTTQLRKIFGEEIDSLTSGSGLTIEDYINQSTSHYIGLDKNTLKSLLNDHSLSKNSHELLITAMLGYKGKKLSHSEEFQKANIKFKTIFMNENGSIKESMSFQNFKFKEIIEENWDDSELRNYFLASRFAFCLFEGNKANPRFKGIKFWNMDEELIETEIRKVWERTKYLVQTGKIYKNSYTNESCFPKSNESFVCHVRPKGKNASDTYPLPIPDSLTGKDYYSKQCFWLNQSFIKQIVNKLFNNQ